MLEGTEKVHLINEKRYNYNINFEWVDTMIQNQQAMIFSPYYGYL